AWGLWGVALGAAFVWGVLIPGGPPLADPPGAALRAYSLPMLRYGFAELRAGRLPLWNPHQACGLPLLTNASVGLLYPPYWPTFGFLPADRALDVDAALHLGLALVGMALLCRHFGMSWGASVVAGIVYAYHGSMRIKLFFPNHLVSAAWLPMVVLLVDRVLARASWRRCGLLGVAVGVMLLGGFRQFEYYALLFLVFPLTVI